MNIFNKKNSAGILAVFEDPEHLLDAVRKLKISGFQKMEAYTPFPVHGLEHALGLPRSKIPYATLLYGLMGGGLAFLLQYWTHAVDWPLNIGGRPLFSWPAYIPITFEATVLFGGVLTVLTLFAVLRLPNFSQPILDERFSADRFGLWIDKQDPNFDSPRIQKILGSCHANEIKNME